MQQRILVKKKKKKKKNYIQIKEKNELNSNTNG